jgi:hypothetical protein
MKGKAMRQNQWCALGVYPDVNGEAGPGVPGGGRQALAAVWLGEFPVSPPAEPDPPEPDEPEFPPDDEWPEIDDPLPDLIPIPVHEPPRPSQFGWWLTGTGRPAGRSAGAGRRHVRH